MKLDAIILRNLAAKVFNTQLQIYQLSAQNKVQQMHALQDRCIKSPAFRIIAINRVTVDATGKKAAGVDNKLGLTGAERMALYKSLVLDGTANPIRRVWIPKPETDEKRPLGIPTIEDRAKQALCLLVLEPEWEAKFEDNSYGFRTGRHPHDAIKQIKNSLLHATKWIYVADVEKCFDTISHNYLLGKLTQPSGSVIHTQIKAWLQAGILDHGSPFVFSSKGTPQGYVISPLLANIALDGLENAVMDEINKFPNRKKMMEQTKVIRYADKFIVMVPDKNRFNTVVTGIDTFLANKIGLNIKKSKTRILHSLDKNLCPDNNTSFQFLNMLIQQRSVGKRSVRKASGNRPVNWKVVILPHPTKVKYHFNQIRKTIKKCTKSSEVIKRLNPIIRGWCQYYRVSDAATYKAVASYNRRLYLLVSNWQKRTHHTRKRINTLWKTEGNNNWVFYCKSSKNKKEYILINYQCVSWSVNSYVKVKKICSPYDGNNIYWVRRLPSKNQGFFIHLMENQKFVCRYCNKAFLATDHLQIDHIIPRFLGGSEDPNNLQVLHKECHSEKTAKERKVKK